MILPAGFSSAEPNPDAVVLLQFHTHFEICRSRIELLRAFNPGTKVYGLFGGDPALLRHARSLERFGCEHVFHDSQVTPAWNKKNTDLAVRGWYMRIGKFVPFTRLYVIQWDLLFFSPLAAVYPRLSSHAVALTGLIKLADIVHYWAWTADSVLSAESFRLLDLVRQKFDYRQEPYACLGPGYSLSREFLDRYSDLDVEDVGHDELRLPLFAQILGIELVDTGFFPRWMDADVERFFNADANEIEPAVIQAELKRPGGVRAFHPCRETFAADAIEGLLAHCSRSE